MPKVLVVFDSKSGNTETMALAVAKGAEKAGNIEVTVKKAEQTASNDLVSADGIIMGSPTYYGLMSTKLKKLVDDSLQVRGKLIGKVGGAFTSSGGAVSGAETTLLSIVQAMLIHGMIIQGGTEGQYYGIASRGKPTKEDLDRCEGLGKRVASLVLRLNPS